jgi:hypothetical protein
MRKAEPEPNSLREGVVTVFSLAEHMTAGQRF